MSVTQSCSVDFPPGMQARELKTALVGWGAYMAALLGYCMLHQWIVSAAVPDVPGSVVWVLQEWGIWLLVTPFLFRSLRRCGREPDRQLPSLLRSGALALIASLAFQVAIDPWTENRGMAPTVVLYLPQYLAAFIGVALIWRFVLHGRSTTADAAEREGASPPPSASPARYPETLLVSKGSGECLLQVERIACISAAANYVEIHSGGQVYLMRATMKQVEQLLPPSIFLRVHRSHIVNIGEIERIRIHRSGNGTVELRCGKVVSLSRSYKTRLRGVARMQQAPWRPASLPADHDSVSA